MTMVNSTVSSTPNRGGVSLRKTNKPLMEKRRRARINDSLTQLKSLVIHSSKKDSSQFSKLEKADILELTVKHLRGLQVQQQQQHHQHQHQLAAQSAPNGTTDTLVNGKYRAGFVECANEVIRYLDQSQGLNQETKSKVVSHLASCLHLVSASQNQSKIAPQPIPQQTCAPPANAAAILAAAAAAASSTTTTTTQLPNGQIIQIVSNPLQNVQPVSDPSVLGLKPTPSNTATTIQGINLSAHADQSINQMTQQPTGNNTINQQAIKSVTNQATPAYIHYAQPLHIQIPPIVSPVLIQKQQQKQTKQVELRESTNIFPSSSSSRSSTSNHSSPPEQVHDVVSSSTSVASSPPRKSASPPSSLYPGHPKARAQKQLNFELSKSCDKFSKCVKYPMTPSSSSSSSSESENTSPLNLSQSPPFSAFNKNKSEKRPHPYMVSSVSQKNFHDHKNSSFHGDYNTFALREGNSNIVSNTASVIVNSRKCTDFAEGNSYWSMIEDERQCIRHQNTPSPASSVGEERLWRPW